MVCFISGTEGVPLIHSENQCLYCLDKKRPPYKRRIRTFKQVSHMVDLMEEVHLKYEREEAMFACPYPHCKQMADSLTFLDRFKTRCSRSMA